MDEIQFISDPGTDAIQQAINRVSRERVILMLLVNCEVEYDGRASGYTGPGDRVVICKPDGTLLVHRPSGNDPVNWQPPGSTFNVDDEDEIPVVISRRSNPREHILIRCLETYALVTFQASDDAPLELSGTEADMHTMIEKRPELIEENLRLIEHERDTPHGSIDFFANDVNGHPVIIEVKRGRGTLSNVDQLRRYTSLYRESNPDARGILVAPMASEKVKRTLRDHDLEFVSLDVNQEASGDIEGTTIDDFTHKE